MNNPSMQVEQLSDGRFQVTVTGELPVASVTQNAKWPWTPWNVSYQRGILDKDGARLLQSLSNLRHVQSTVEAKAAVREQEKADRALVASAAAQPAAPAQTVVAEVPAPAPAPAPKSPAKKSRKGRS